MMQKDSLKRFLIPVLILLMLSLAGCRAQSTKLNVIGGGSVTEIDDFKREVTIGHDLKRIVSLSPTNTEILFSLGLADKLVGVTDFCDYPKEALTKEKVGGFSEPSIERIIELKPDIIFASRIHEKYLEEFEDLGLTVFFIDSKRLVDIFLAIDKVGKLTGSTSQAKEVIATMNEKLFEIDEKVLRVSDGNKPLVYYEIWSDPLMTVGPKSLIGEAIERAGGKNFGRGLVGEYPQFSLETLIESDPKVIIAPKGSMGDPKEIATRKGWESISAVKEGKVFVINEDLLVRFGPRVVDGIFELAVKIHPELF